MKLPLVYHPDYVTPLPPKHRFPMPKFGILYELLVGDGIASEANTLAPVWPEPDDFLRVHTQEYFDAFCAGGLDDLAMRKIGLPWSKNLVHRSTIAVGGTIRTVQLALEHGLACNIAGGTHHAFPGHGGGFCIFNDMAIAARRAQFDGYAQRIMIIDLDVHQGDGTAAIFQNDDSVFTFSMHCAENYPSRKQKSDFDLPVPANMEDHGYMNMLSTVLPSLLDSFQPDLVIYDAGADPHEEDRLGLLCLTDAGLFTRDRFVLQECIEREIPVAGVIGGGYGTDLDRLAYRHSILHRVADEHFRATYSMSVTRTSGMST